MRDKIRPSARLVLAAAMVAVGVAHFVEPGPFVKIVPPWLPWPFALVLISGGFEIVGGLGLLPRRTRALAGWGLIALYVAVFPANIYMATHEIQMGDTPVPTWALVARLPFQAVFIALAYWVSRPANRRRRGADRPQ